jgi:hypothetical protein
MRSNKGSVTHRQAKRQRGWETFTNTDTHSRTGVGTQHTPQQLFKRLFPRLERLPEPSGIESKGRAVPHGSGALQAPWLLNVHTTRDQGLRTYTASSRCRQSTIAVSTDRKSDTAAASRACNAVDSCTRSASTMWSSWCTRTGTSQDWAGPTQADNGNGSVWPRGSRQVMLRREGMTNSGRSSRWGTL